MNESTRFSLVKPTQDTPFHIDFQWWKQHDNNWRISLLDCLCSEHKIIYSNLEEDHWVDWVNPETAEVNKMDGLQQVLMVHCARQPGFLTVNTTLVDAVFRAFLTCGNAALNPKELAAQINKPAETILRTLAGPQVYKGLRPYHN